MPGKWSGLKGQVPLAPTDSNWQSKVNTAKQEFLSLTKAQKARRFCEVRDQKDSLEDRISEFNITLEALSQLMITEMEKDGLDLFRLDTGDSLSIKDEPYVSVEDKTKFLEWIKVNNLEDLLTVHYMTLSSMTKDRLQAGQNAPPGLKVFLKQSITRRRARS